LVSPNRPDGQPHPRAWSAGHWDVFRQQAKSFDALPCYEWAFDFLVMPDGSESVGGMTLAAATVAAVLAGLLPGLRVMRRPPAALLASATPTSSVGHSERWLLRGTAVLQIAMTLALLTGAGLLIRTAKNLAAIRPGYQSENILTMSVTPLKGNWFDFHVQALQRVAALPGVQNAAFGSGS